MKYILIHSMLLDIETEYVYLASASIDPFTCSSLEPVNPTLWNPSKWTSCTIVEADEGFDTLCMLKYGFQPIILLDHEYEKYSEDKIYFFDKLRSWELKTSFSTLGRPRS